MKRIKYFEEYIIAKDSRVSTVLDNMVKRMKQSFEGGNNVFSEEEQSILTLIDIERSTVNDATEKNIILNFEDNDYYYQVTFIIMVSGSDDIVDGYLKISLYDLDTNEKLISDHYNLKLKEEDGFVKVNVSNDNETQPTQESKIYEAQDVVQDGFVVLEKFIITKVAELKEKLEKNKEE